MSEIEIDANVTKSGETCIRTTIGRSADGLTLKVWAHPRVEDFIRSLGTGERLDVQTLGRHWFPVGKDQGQKILVYDMTQFLGTINYNDQFSFRLDRPGLPLIDHLGDEDERQPFDPDRDEPVRRRPAFKMQKECLNLGFLRLAGISEGSGVSFSIHGVYTREGVDKLASRIEQATNRFYREFLKPYKLIVTVSTQPVSPDY